MTDGSGPNFSDLWAYYDPDTSSWKMSQDCLPLTEDTLSVRSSVTWPTSGMTVNGRCYPLPMSARRTSASASGLWPTPTTSDASGGGNRNSENSKAHAGVSLTDACLTGESSTPRSEVSGQLNPTWVEWLMGFPDGWTDCGD